MKISCIWKTMATCIVRVLLMVPCTTPRITFCLACADHGYWTLNTLFTEKILNLKRANKIVEDAPKSTWSDGVAPPPLHPHVLKGAKDGKPKKAGKLRFKAADMRKWALARLTRFMHAFLTPTLIPA